MKLQRRDSDESNSNEEVEVIESTQNKKRKNNERSPKLKKIKYEDISLKPKKEKKKNDLNRAPTVQELNNLKETENLYNNNLFRLQIAELVKEISIKNKRKKAFNSWLELFKQSLEDMKEFEDVKLSIIKPISKKKISSTGQFINSISKYRCDVKTDQDLTLMFVKPLEIQLFGLHECGSLPGPQMEVSINVKMPQSCLHKKDFVNNRYFVKRFYYLLYIQEYVPSYTKKITYHESNVLLPVLEIQPTEDAKLTVKIYITPAEDTFKLSRFLPNINNVKKTLFSTIIMDTDVLKNTPTLYYNTSLAFDVTLGRNYEYIKNLLSEHPTIQEGIKLICVWLKQRELQIGFGAFTETLILFLVGYLFVTKKVSKQMSSYQVTRIFWNFLTVHDLSKDPISLGECSKDTLELFKQNFDVVFVDYTGCYNLAAFLNSDTLKKVSAECKIALKQLDNGKVESFQLLFLTKFPFALQYDLLLNFTESLSLKSCETITDEEKSKHIGYEDLLNIKSVAKLLAKGLSNRILHLVPRIEIQYSIETSNPIKSVIFGINLNPETAFHFIEMGPALTDHLEADQFRKFWDYLSSNRRFRDGSNHVAVYFKTNTIRAKRNIIKRIIKYLLVEKNQLKFKLYYDDLEEFIINRTLKAPYPTGTNEEGCLKAISLSDELGQKIRSLEMSLSITGILGISDLFCYCDLFPPIASSYSDVKVDLGIIANSLAFKKDNIENMPRYIKPVELVLCLEHSTKWPNNLEHLRALKTSFLLEIAKQLEDNHNIISNINQKYMDLYYQGVVFRYVIFIPKEIALMKKEQSDSGVVSYKETAMACEMEKKLVVLPKIVGALKRLQLQYPSFGSGTTLIKKWLRSQMVDEFNVPDIVVNLLNASLYVGNSAYSESCTPQISFLRFLKFISQYDWELEPLIVNFNDEISSEDLADLESKFQQHRASLQPLYIITPFDEGQSLFTKKSPTKEMMNRIKLLADFTLNLLIERTTGISFHLSSLFTPTLEGFNVIIHLNANFNSRRYEDQSIDEPQIILEEYMKRPNEKIPIVGFSPVDLYLNTLREGYGAFAVFLHNSYGGNIIGVLWIPSALEAKDFKVGLVAGRKIEGNKLVLNIDALIDDFYIIGKGLVKWVEKK